MNKFLINNEYKEPLAVRIMEDKEKFTILIIGIVLFLLLFTFLTPFSPLNIWSVKDKVAYAMMVEQNKQELQELVDSYSNNGVSLSEDDYKLVVEEDNNNKEVKIVVTNEDKRNQMIKNIQQKFNIIIGKYVSYAPETNSSEYNPMPIDKTPTAPPSPGAPEIDADEEDKPEIPDFNEILDKINDLNTRLNDWIDKSIKADEELGITTDYINKLIDQRFTGEPNSEALLFDEYSYSYMGECLNAQAFVALNTKRADIEPEEYLYDFTKLSTHSADLFYNILKYRIYEETFSLEDFSKIEIEEYNQTYNLVLSNNITEEYNSVAKIKFDDYEMIFTLKNNEIIILDINNLEKEGGHNE